MICQVAQADAWQKINMENKMTVKKVDGYLTESGDFYETREEAVEAENEDRLFCVINSFVNEIENLPREGIVQLMYSLHLGGTIKVNFEAAK